MRTRDAFLLTVVAFVWGFNFVVIRWGLNAFPPLLFSALRFSVCMLPIAFGLPRPPIAWPKLLLLGVTLGLLVFGLLYLGIYAGLGAGMASAVMQAQVFFTMALGSVVFGERLGALRGIALGLGFFGLLLVALHGGSQFSGLGFFLVLLGAASWALSNILIKTLPNVPAFNLMVWISIVPPLPLFVLSYVFEGHAAIADAITHVQWTGIVTVLYTSALSTVFAYGVWGAMLQRYPAHRVSPFALLIPVFGLACSGVFLGTKLSAADLAGPACILAALALNGLAGRVSPPVTAQDPPAELHPAGSFTDH